MFQSAYPIALTIEVFPDEPNMESRDKALYPLFAGKTRTAAH